MYTLTQVSIFYLLIIVVLAYFGFQYSVKIGATVGMALGEAAGSALGAVLGVFLSYQMYQYAKKNGMIRRS
jgi:hypothetical protein